MKVQETKIRDFKISDLILCAALSLLTGCSENAHPVSSGVTVFVNGDILAMTDADPSAEALAMRAGKIIAVGSEQDVRETAGDNAQIHDLLGKTLIPGLIDTHGHIAMGAFTESVADLQPDPAGDVNSLTDLIEKLNTWHADNPDAEWIMGFGYDDSLLEEGRHPTRAELDAISSDKPVMLMHVSGHLVACNTLCLTESGITANTPNPPGGNIRRMSGTNEPSGVLEEKATWLAFAKMPRPNAQETIAAIIAQQQYYAGYGITTAQEGATELGLVTLLQAMAEAGQLSIDLVAYPAVKTAQDFNNITPSRNYKNGFRVGGAKVTLDGSPQGKTAWLTHPYHIAPEGSENDYAGYPILKDETVNAIVKRAFEDGTQLISHTNGDAASDQLLSGVKAANIALGNADRRTVMIHAQTVRDDQIDAMKIQNVMPSYFASHTFFWGDWHRDSVLGPQRAARISPLASTLSRDVNFTIHNDAPVVPPDMMRLVWTAVNRETRSGKTLGEAERISPEEALKAVTINAAYQYFEEGIKGTLEVGKLADLVILSDNPTTIPPDKIKDIYVLKTYKDGQVIFSAKE